MVALLGSAPAQGEEILERGSWQPPETLTEAVQRPAFNALLSEYAGTANGRVEIAHGGGAEGSAWAGEVRDWLVAMGIPSSRIRLEPGLADPGVLRLAVAASGDPG